MQEFLEGILRLLFCGINIWCTQNDLDRQVLIRIFRGRLFAYVHFEDFFRMNVPELCAFGVKAECGLNPMIIKPPLHVVSLVSHCLYNDGDESAKQGQYITIR